MRSTAGRYTPRRPRFPWRRAARTLKLQRLARQVSKCFFIFLAVPNGPGKLAGVIGMQASAGGLDEPGPELVAQSTMAPLCLRKLA